MKDPFRPMSREDVPQSVAIEGGDNLERHSPGDSAPMPPTQVVKDSDLMSPGEEGLRRHAPDVPCPTGDK